MRNIIFLLLFSLNFISDSSAQNKTKIKEESDQIIAWFKSGDFSKISNKVEFNYRSYFTAQLFEKDWQELTGTYGKYVKHRYVTLESAGNYNMASCLMQLEYLPFVLNINFNEKFEILSLNFVPAHKIHVNPNYVDVEKFTEQKIIIRNGVYELESVLTTPIGNGPFPLVVIVGEAGPTDKDGSYENNRPYKDIASGLASNGYTVFRMDKRAANFGLYMVQQKSNYESFTCKEDYLDDLYIALDSLVKIPSIDKDKMVMLGHGQGGMLIPYIFKEKPYFKAGMMLGVNHKRVQEMMIDQYNYLSKVTPGKKAEYDEQIERAIRSMNKKLNPLTQHHLMPYDVQASYWVWLNKYPHVKMATKLKQPLVFFQGGRDYQVSDENFELWKSSLAKKKNVAFFYYKKLNHIFFEGETESTYSEYFVKGNIPDYLIKDMVDWLNKLDYTIKK